MFGNAMAAYVLHHLAGKPLEPLHIKNRHKLNHTLFMQMQMRERDRPQYADAYGFYPVRDNVGPRSKLTRRPALT